ncbi:MAG: hypothetical protein WCN98_17000, partial [Verrucomicrobiaceae bacterium]
MVHVPELRKFTSEAKTTIAQLAWIVASAVSAEMNPQPARIAVGIRGAILYDRAWTGIPLKDIENPEATVQYRSRDSEDAKNTMANFIDDLEKMSRTAVTATANKATAAAKS